MRTAAATLMASCLATVLLASAAAPGAPTAAAPAAPATTSPADSDKPGLVILGVDGMDPVILRRYIAQGLMPEFERLVKEGSFVELGTSNPPQSPVAWSNFVTGMNPGGHGIYDFLHRDRHSYMPITSANEVIEDPELPTTLSLFGYDLPLSGGSEPGNNRSGTPFWDLLAAAEVPVEVYRIPGNFPVPPSDAFTLSGMGTPDLLGGAGAYSWWTDVAPEKTGHLTGDLKVITIDDTNLDGVPDTISTTVTGPAHPLKHPPEPEEGQTPEIIPPLSAALTIHVDAENDVAWLRCGDSEAILTPGTWSPWLDIAFDALPYGLMPIGGTGRFYLKELRPHFQLYCSPINFATNGPAAPITTPDDDVATDIYDALGHIFTQGMPEETNALKERMFDDADYLSQVDLVHRDGEELLDYALNRFDPGDMLFFYLSNIDLQCHMLWRLKDPKFDNAAPHPAFEGGTRHANVIEGFYKQVDDILGRARSQLPPDTHLIVMSDHGFQPFTREVHLNAWLRDEGYLVLQEAGDDLLRDAVDACGWVAADLTAARDEALAARPKPPRPPRGTKPKIEPLTLTDVLTHAGRGGETEAMLDKLVNALGDGSNPGLRQAVRAGDIVHWSDARTRWEKVTGDLFAIDESGDFADVDWSQTVAFGTGFNGLYLNLRDREVEGVVDPADADRLLDEIAAKLAAWTDAELGAGPVKHAYKASEAYSGTRVPEAPDLVVGYDRLFCCSDESTLGEITVAQIEDNLSRWSGNHLMDPSVVPGVLLSTRTIEGDGYDLTDVTASILAHYGLPTADGMVGEPIRFR